MASTALPTLQLISRGLPEIFFILESFSKVQRAGEGREHAGSKSNLSTCDKAQLEVVAAAADVVNVIGEVACSVGERERAHESGGVEP